jgi:hypothetical protein
MTQSLIQVQTEYIDTMRAAIQRWSFAGHYPRIRKGAWNKAFKALGNLGFRDDVARLLIKDAHDVLILELESDGEVMGCITHVTRHVTRLPDKVTLNMLSR